MEFVYKTLRFAHHHQLPVGSLLDVRLSGGAERIFDKLTSAGWNLRKPEILDLPFFKRKGTKM